MSKERFTLHKTNEGPIYLSRSTYGETGVHVSRGVDRWAERNASAFDRIIDKHDKRTGARHESDLYGTPNTELYTQHNPAGARDTIIINTEFNSRGKAFSWAAYASEF